MQTFTDSNGVEWPLEIEVQGKTFTLHLLDTQTGDSYTPNQAPKGWISPHGWNFLDIIYKEA